MQADSLRRLMVFGVCLLGVGALYLVPSMARAPHQVGSPTPPRDVPTVNRPPRSPATSPATPSPSPVLATATGYDDAGSDPSAPSSGAPTSDPPAPAEAPQPSNAPPVDEADPRPEASEAPATRRTRSTPFAPGPPRDETPPTSVTELVLDKATPKELRVLWAPSTDDSGVVSYEIWLDGFPVRTTLDTTATLDWFNDDNPQHVVQVHAVDGARNRSRTPATLLVIRPTPAPSPRPAETPAPTTTATATPPTPSAPPDEPTPYATSSAEPSPPEPSRVGPTPTSSASEEGTG